MSRYKNFVFDLDGVVYLDGVEIPGAGDALATVAMAGGKVLFATNNASRTRADFARRIEEITGFDASSDQIVSSAMAAASLLGSGERALAVAGPGVVEAIGAVDARVVVDWREAEAVVVGFDLAMTYERLRDGALAIRNGARFIATNDDATFPVPEGLWPGAGASISFLETATDRDADVVAGKPHRPFRELLEAKLDPGPTLLIGDRPETDLATGLAQGWDTVLVLTGVVDNPDQVPARLQPTFVIPSIADLVGLIDL